MITAEIAKCVNGELVGNAELSIHGVAPVVNLAANSLSFMTDRETDTSSIHPDACVLISPDIELEFGFTVIKVANPKFAFAKIADKLVPFVKPSGIDQSIAIGERSVVNADFIAPNVSIGTDVTIAEGCEIHAGAFIGDNVSIDKNSIVHANAAIYVNTSIGKECVIHAGAVIGAAGFGYVREGTEIIRFPQIGSVVIEDHVEIGANSCVDRGALGATRIGSHTKIDNLVQIAHNVDIGQRVLIASQVGISGSVVIEDDVVIAGQVGIADHVVIKKGAVIGARSAVFPGKIVREGVWAGTPVRKLEDYKVENALVRSLPRIKKEIEELKKKLI